MPETIIPTARYTDVEKFFEEFLSPTRNLLIKHHPPGSIAFRGQSDAEWPLVPSALRKESWLTNGGGRWVQGGTLNRAAQTRFEAITLRTFFNICDQQGLRLPEDGQEIRLIFDKLGDLEHTHDEDQFNEEFRNWPNNRVLSLMALAQHSGVPTRLLDWTWSAYVAAYFAASGCLEKERSSGEFAVWCIDLRSIRLIQIGSSEFGTKPDSWPIRVVSAPAADNPNLKAQQGLFILQTSVGERDNLTGVSLEDTITWVATLLNRPRKSLLKKATLPGSMARELLILLQRKGIHASSVFPSFAGAARFLMEQRQLSH